MRWPARGYRGRAAAWVAVAVAVLTTLIGTIVLVTTRDDQPSRIVVRQDLDGAPLVRVAMTDFVVGAGIVTLGICLLLMVVDLLLRRAPRPETSAAAAGLSIVFGVIAYSLPFAQRQADELGFWPLLIGGALGAGSGLGLYRWARPAPPAPEAAGVPLPAGARTVDAPTTARLAWVGTARMAWPIRFGQVALRLLPLAGLYWWIGMLPALWFVMLAAIPLFLLGTRSRQVVVDYSGVGMRGGGGRFVPTGVPLADISSAETRTISALRDFGGWGRRKRPGGGDAWIGRSGEALVVHRVGKPDVVFTVDDADEAAAVLNTHVARYAAWLAASRSFVDVPHPSGDRG